jgi:hypothetical protein
MTISPDTRYPAVDPSFRRGVERDRWKPKQTVSDVVRRKQEDKAYKAMGMKKHTVRAEDGTVKEVWCFSTSYRAMGFQDHQISAAERFSRDWETAYPQLRSASMEPPVDNAGRMSAKLHRSADSHGRLMECRKAIGQRAWEIVVGVVIYGATVTGMMRTTGLNNRAISQMIDDTFDDLAGFYSGERRKDRAWTAFEEFNRERAAMIEAAEREVG